MPIKQLATYMPRLGRISLGYKGRSKSGKVIPFKSKTIVFTSDSEVRLAYLASLYGGTIKAAEESPDGLDRYVLVSTVTDMQVMLPADNEEMVLSEWMECHTASGLKRRCDGETVDFGRDIDKETGEVTTFSDTPCVCTAQKLEGDAACKPTLRLHVILPDALEAEGLGVWVVSSSGWRSNSHVKSGVDMLRMFFGRVAGLPLTLGVAEAKALDKRGRAMPYRHFTLSSRLTMAQALQSVRERPAGLAAALGVAPLALPSPDELHGSEHREDEPTPSAQEAGVCPGCGVDEGEEHWAGCPEMEDPGQPAGAKAPPPSDPSEEEQPEEQGVPAEAEHANPDQVRAIAKLAIEEGTDLPGILEELGLKDPREMSPQQASQTIIRLSNARRKARSEAQQGS